MPSICVRLLTDVFPIVVLTCIPRACVYSVHAEKLLDGWLTRKYTKLINSRALCVTVCLSLTLSLSHVSYFDAFVQYGSCRCPIQWGRIIFRFSRWPHRASDRIKIRFIYLLNCGLNCIDGKNRKMISGNGIDDYIANRVDGIWFVLLFISVLLFTVAVSANRSLNFMPFFSLFKHKSVNTKNCVDQTGKHIITIDDWNWRTLNGKYFNFSLFCLRVLFQRLLPPHAHMHDMLTMIMICVPFARPSSMAWPTIIIIKMKIRRMQNCFAGIKL